MNTYLDCVPCFLRQGLDAARNITDDGRIHEQIVREILRLAADLNLNRPPPCVGQTIHRRLRELTGLDDPYRAAKSRFNQLAISMLPELRAVVRRDALPLIAAAKAAIAANIFFLLKVKCPVIAKHTDLPVGTHAVIHARRGGSANSTPKESRS